MYQYTFSNEDTDKLTQKAKDYDTMLESFKDVDKKFSSNDEGPLNLEKMTFDKLSNDEIKNRAKDSLNDFKDEKIKGIDDSYNQKNQHLDKELNETKIDGENRIEKTQNLYASLKENAKNDAVKRGLSRSSIVINILDAFDNNMLKEYNKINDEITKKVDSLNNQKQFLDEQKQNALNAFDILYATKLSNKIDEINKSLVEEENKVLEYNNEIAKKEAEYEQKRKQNALDYAGYLEKYGTNGIEKLKKDEKFQFAKDYLMKLPKDEAINELNSNRVFTTELGSINFNKLKLMLTSRK